MTSHYFDFDLFRLGPNSSQRERLNPAESARLLVAFQTSPEQAAADQAYLEKILAASGFDQPAASCLLLPVYGKEALDLNELRLPATVTALVFLGLSTDRCGFALRIQDYELCRLNRRTLLFGDSVAAIHAERQAGGKAMSGKLWRALKSLSEAA